MNVFLIDFLAFVIEEIQLHLSQNYEKDVIQENYGLVITFIIVIDETSV